MAATTEIAVGRVRVPWCSTVTPDAVRHFAWGIGDNNPLWHDPDHAQQSRWGGVIAPSCFAYAVDETTVAPGHDELRRIYRRVEWVWYDVLRSGTEIVPAARLREEIAGPEHIEQHGQVEFRRRGGQLLAEAAVTCIRTASPATPISERPELRYSGDEIDAIEQAIMAEARRGTLPRWWEEVQLGERTEPITKGPLSIMDVVAWCAATQGMATVADAYSDGGLHAETATGPQQTAWIAQCVIDWMGDDGFLHRLDVDLITNPPLGSTTTITGRVAGLRIVDRHRLAELEIEAIDQGGALSATGRATVLLPSTEVGPVVLPLDMPILV